MKKTVLLFAVALLLTSLPCAAQGPLTPPGAPAPTMKTLEQIEPRTPIYSAPYAITQSGSYYLVSNLHSTTDGIFIQTSGVTLDLMGFSLTGDGGVGDHGITVATLHGTGFPINNVVIKGGRISGFSRGLQCEYMNNSRLERLEVSDNTDHGIYLDGSVGANYKCNGNTVAHCTISGNGSIGIYLYGAGGQCNGNTLTDCTIIGNDAGGAYFAGTGTGHCDYNTVTRCTFSDNGATGIYLSGLSGHCNGNSVVDSTISSNTSYGVFFDGVSGKCNGNTLARCTVSGNADHGIFLYRSTGECSGNTIRENTISENAGRGLYAHKANGNRIEANNIWGTTTYGISTESTTDNFILQNTCVGYATNFSLSTNDTYVPVVPASPAPQPVDPRTPISSAPYAITQPGSYYLVSNLTPTAGAISIQTSGVTLDLNGFSLTGNGLGPYDYGITVETNVAIDKVTIKGGTISGFQAGLWCKNMNNSQIKDLVVSDNTYGIFFSGSSSGACNGNSLTDCIISENDEWGLRLFGTQGECNGNRITGCTISGNGSYGVWLHNGTGGQCDGNLLQGNQVIMNTDRGIYLQGANGNRIEANNIWGTSGSPTYGIQTIGNTNNFILRNTCVGQTDNFDLSPNDTYGPVVATSGELPFTGFPSHPWANFSR